jgi:hypothetical protein
MNNDNVEDSTDAQPATRTRLRSPDVPGELWRHPSRALFKFVDSLADPAAESPVEVATESTATDSEGNEVNRQDDGNHRVGNQFVDGRPSLERLEGKKEQQQPARACFDFDFSDSELSREVGSDRRSSRQDIECL